MTIVDEPRTGDSAVGSDDSTAVLDTDERWDLDAESGSTDGGDSGPSAATSEERPGLAELGRPLLATSLVSAGAALVVGGTFGSWAARVLCVLAVLVGSGWAYLVPRTRNPKLTQILILPLLLAFGVVALMVAGGAADDIAGLVSDAVNSGRLFRPPVPFDPGWRVVLVVLFGLLAYSAGAMATVGERPKTGVGVVVPFVLLGLFSQPDGSTFIASIFAFVPTLAALAVLFGDDGERANELGSEFELRRAIQGGVGVVAVVGVLAALNSASFLFPEPVYNPDDRPQKPRAVPLSESDDRVLFTVVTDSVLTGPWRIGALDVYDDDAFQSVPSETRLVDFPADGVLSELRQGRTQESVTITVADLGDTAVLPTLAGATSVAVTDPSLALQVDPRYQVVRVSSGRVPQGFSYTLSVPPYATEDELEAADPVTASDFENELVAPADVPPVVEELLRQAPANPWLKLDFLRQTLLDRAVASGAGAPIDVTPDRVQEILTPPDPEAETDEAETDEAETDVAEVDAGAPAGEDDEPDPNEATPFEIVATEALLARWAGIPSRIGFGFDGLNVEDEVLTVRPRNSAQWLEVWFEGYGWVPLVGQPEQAKASIDNDPNARSTPTIDASSDIAAQVYVIYDQKDARLLYERVRLVLVRIGPWLLVAALAYTAYPGVAKVLRRRRRREWAARRGPLAQVLVEYAEFRDTAIDLSVGDDYDTPLEYLHKTIPDREHEELAWLVARGVYGDLVDLGPDDVDFARSTATSLRSRLLRGQPPQSRALAWISRASVEIPWNDEMPNIRVVRIWPRVRRILSVLTRPARTVGAVVRRVVVTAVSAPRNAVVRFLVRREQNAALTPVSDSSGATS